VKYPIPEPVDSFTVVADWKKLAIGNRRRELGWPQHAVATALGTAQSHISDIETGVTAPQVDTMIKYARLVGLRLDLIYYVDVNE
jgi:DNA-binding XRE family transcriptional regulator